MVNGAWFSYFWKPDFSTIVHNNTARNIIIRTICYYIIRFRCSGCKKIKTSWYRGTRECDKHGFVRLKVYTARRVCVPAKTRRPIVLETSSGIVNPFSDIVTFQDDPPRRHYNTNISVYHCTVYSCTGTTPVT